jgi:hypothetical protein
MFSIHDPPAWPPEFIPIKRMAEIQVNLIPSDMMTVMALSRLRRPNQLDPPHRSLACAEK